MDAVDICVGSNDYCSNPYCCNGYCRNGYCQIVSAFAGIRIVPEADASIGGRAASITKRELRVGT